MKTIRTNCFETNSSSTHSLTVNAPTNLDLKPTATFLPNEAGKILSVINDSTDYESCLEDKLNFALTFAYTIGDQEGFDRVISTVEKFTGIPVEVHARYWDDTENKYVTSEVKAVLPAEEVKDDEDDDDYDDEEGVVAETFYSYVREYGHGSVSEFISEGKKVIASEQSILVFIFTNHCAFSRESHYDG